MSVGLSLYDHSPIFAGLFCFSCAQDCKLLAKLMSGVKSSKPNGARAGLISRP